MARTPSLSVAEAESILGARGTLSVTSDNKLTVRKWLTANGIPGMFAACLSRCDLEKRIQRYNRRGIGIIRKHAMRKRRRRGRSRAEMTLPNCRLQLPPTANGANDGQASIALFAKFC